jgi:hypothetical protein
MKLNNFRINRDKMDIQCLFGWCPNVQRLPPERPKHAVALETCIEINKYKIYAKFIPFPNNNNKIIKF